MFRKFKIYDEVRIVGEAKGSINEFARITMIGSGSLEGKYHVANINMPYAGSICKFMREDEIEGI